MKKVIYLDMDGVLANFSASIKNPCPPGEKPPERYEEGFYRSLQVMPGAKEAVKELIVRGYDVHIASKPVKKSLYCASEKYQWISEHFPELLGKIFLTCNKALLLGECLIDDRAEEWQEFQGLLIKFNPKEPKSSWEEVLEKLK